MEEKLIRYGVKNILKSDYGPVGFGWVTSASVVSWSDKSLDLLINQLGRGFYLYPSKKLSNDELINDPIKVGGHTGPYMPYEEVATPADWNKDGKEDLIVAGMTGYMYYLERKGDFPDIHFERSKPLTDENQNLLFNIPYDNPNHPVMNNLDGYFDTAFFNYPAPIVYPFCDCEGINLIIGDWAGNLWWMPDLSNGKSKPVYRGEKYIKPKKEIVSRKGKKLLERFGEVYVKPKEKICNEKGVPFLLGEGYDTGVKYKGGVTRPVVYYNHITKSYDLLVLAGTRHPEIYYLQRINKNKKEKPVFKNKGTVDLSGMPESYLDCFNFHSKMIIYHAEGYEKLMISSKNNMLVFKKNNKKSIKPEFEFDHVVSGKDVITSGYNFTEVLTDVKGKRYLLDNPNHFELRKIDKHGTGIYLSSEKIVLKDQHGIFKPEGETDPQYGKDWGFHRACKWNFDGSGKQHLIVGTDKGFLYLLIEEEKLGLKGKYQYKSVGPLKDNEGNIIKTHNRACAGGIDLNGDGIDDLVIGGVTYQIGFKTDPNPGGNFYYVINTGVDKDGLPILTKAKPLKIKKHTFDIYTNSHIQIQCVNFGDNKGRRIVLATQKDGFEGRIFKPLKDEVALEYTGKKIRQLSVDNRLLDINDDGKMEFIFGGGEEGIAYYRNILL